MSIMLSMLVGAATVSSMSVTVEGRRVVTVSTAGLDLTEVRDLHRLDARVDSAVRQVCAVSGRTLADYEWQRTCLADTRNAARPRVAQLVAAAGQQAQVAAR